MSAFKDTLDIFQDGSCVSLWRLNTDTNDLSGTYDGTEVNGTTYAPGEFDNGYHSDKALSQYIQINNLGTYLSTTENLTLSFHTKPITDAELSAGGSNASFQFNWFNAVSTYSKLRIQLRESQILMQWGLTGQHYQVKSFDPLKYYHIVVAKTGTNLKVFIDEVLETNSTTELLWNNGTLHTHASMGADLTWMPTSITTIHVDQVRLFNRGITDAGELLKLRNEGNIAIAALTGTATLIGNTAIRGYLQGTASMFGDPVRPAYAHLAGIAALQGSIAGTTKRGFDITQEIKNYYAEQSFILRQEIETDPVPTTLIQRTS